MNPVHNPTVSSLHPSPLFAPTPWVCHSRGQVGKSCCVPVPPYQPTLITSSPRGIASPDIYWGRSPFSGSRVGISYFASVTPAPYISPILPSPPYQPPLITSSPRGIASPDIYWGRSPYSEGQVGISHFASVPPVPFVSPILPWPPYQPTSITPPPISFVVLVCAPNPKRCLILSSGPNVSVDVQVCN